MSSILIDNCDFINNNKEQQSFHSPMPQSPNNLMSTICGMQPLMLTATSTGMNNSSSPPSSLQSLCSNVSSSGNEKSSIDGGSGNKTRVNIGNSVADNLLLDIDDTICSEEHSFSESPKKTQVTETPSNGALKLALNAMNDFLKQKNKPNIFEHLTKNNVGNGSFLPSSCGTNLRKSDSRVQNQLNQLGRRIPLEDLEKTSVNPFDNSRFTTQSPSYKNLSWREKDRRRRFREEWKHTWLVIPEGKFEVKCLVCHKVMTQRKLDTIKRHTTRKHNELMSISDRERQNLFDQLNAFHQRISNVDQTADTIQDNSNKSIAIFQNTLVRLGIPIESKQSMMLNNMDRIQPFTVGSRGRGRIPRFLAPPRIIQESQRFSVPQEKCEGKETSRLPQAMLERLKNHPGLGTIAPHHLANMDPQQIHCMINNLLKNFKNDQNVLQNELKSPRRPSQQNDKTIPVSQCQNHFQDSKQLPSPSTNLDHFLVNSRNFSTALKKLNECAVNLPPQNYRKMFSGLMNVYQHQYQGPIPGPVIHSALPTAANVKPQQKDYCDMVNISPFAHPFSAIALASETEIKKVSSETNVKENAREKSIGKLQFISRLKKESFENLCNALKNRSTCFTQSTPEKRPRNSIDEEETNSEDYISELTNRESDKFELHSLKLDNGENIINRLESYIEDHDLKGIFILSSNGGVQSLNFKHVSTKQDSKFNMHKSNQLKGDFRIISMNGEIILSEENQNRSVHLQMVLSRSDGEIFAGEVDESVPVIVKNSCGIHLGVFSSNGKSVHNCHYTDEEGISGSVSGPSTGTDSHSYMEDPE